MTAGRIQAFAPVEGPGVNSSNNYALPEEEEDAVDDSKNYELPEEEDEEFTV